MKISFLSSFFFSSFFFHLFFFCCFVKFVFCSLNSNMQQNNNKVQKLSYYRETGLKPKKCQKRKEISFVPMSIIIRYGIRANTHTCILYFYK